MIKIFTANFTTDGSGVLNASITVPGTYGALLPYLPGYQGRQVLKIECWFAAPLSGDMITSFYVSDDSNVIPVPFRAAFPNYPTLRTWDDSTSPSQNRGITLFPGNFLDFKPFSTVVNAPSQTVMHILGQKSSSVVDTFYVNIYWDDFS